MPRGGCWPWVTMRLQRVFSLCGKTFFRLMPAHSWLELPAGQGPACPSAGLPGLLGRGAGSAAPAWPHVLHCMCVCMPECAPVYHTVTWSLWPGGSPSTLDPAADMGTSGLELLALLVLSVKQIPRSRMTGPADAGMLCALVSLEGGPCCAFPAGQGPSACPHPHPQG